MTPMEEMAFAEAVESGVAQAGPGIEQAIGNVDGPYRKHEQRGDPEGQTHVSDPCEGERPDQGYGGRIEAGEVPEAQRGGGLEAR